MKTPNTQKRKHILLKNEIIMLQNILMVGVSPTTEYRAKLSGKLEELKRRWYKVRGKKK